MPWTNEQSGRILAEFWENGGQHTKIAHCPADGAQLELHFAEVGKEYGLMARCPVCESEENIGREIDPKRREFRQWTPEDVKQVEPAYRGGGVKCPVCDTPIDVSLKTGGDLGEHYLLRCIRCNNSHVEIPGKHEAPWNGEERRKHPRTRLQHIVQVSQDCPEGGLQRTVMGGTYDMSEGGMQFDAQAAFAVGANVTVSFTLGEQIIEASARVIHCASIEDGSIRTGVLFTNLSDADRALIADYCRRAGRPE
ncbi:MAG: PilZ domain-containing protein [Planctomycetota bacterium]